MNSMMYIRAVVFMDCVLNGILLVSGQVSRNTYCYGDSSHANNLVDISCASGEVIRILNIVAATKASLLGCPSEDHDYTPAEQEKCCTYNASDCMRSYTGNTDSYYNCTGKTRCSGIPIVFQPSSCNYTTHPPFTNYLIIEYNCVSDGLLNGACTRTQDCLVNNTICSNNVCQCDTGYSEYEAMCYEDGSPNGGCLLGDTCTYENAYCSTIGSQCKCRTGFIEDGDRCIKISSTVRRPGYCLGDSSHISNLVDITCSSGVIHVLDVLTGAKPLSVGCPEVDQVYTPALQEACCTYNESTDCIASFTGPTDAYYNCNGKVHCEGIPVVQQQTNCPGTVQYPRFTNYLVLEYVCVPEGQIQGPCDDEDLCLDRNSQCFEQICQCVEGFSDRDHNCWEDGTPGVACKSNRSCEDPNAICSLSDNTCICVTGYALMDGSCVKYCTSSSDCGQNQTYCEEGVCVCLSGYGLVNGECMKDEDVGGICSYDGTCREMNAVCGTNNVCACRDGFSVVDGTCKQDGSIGGLCGDSIGVVCTDTNARCSPSDRGRCVCIDGYQNVSGICKQDGCAGCDCQSELDCTESNSECGSDSKCQCLQEYTNIDGSCSLDGSLNGTCLPDFTCLDPQAVCINRKCQCNDVKNYKDETGECVRKDGHLNGKCLTAPLPCMDSNAFCDGQTNTCFCTNGYFEVNGVCKRGNTSLVTSCVGTSPYNTLAPDCDRNSSALEIRTYTRRKLVSTGCTKYLNLYNHTYHQECCTADQNDCSTNDIAQGSCSAVYYRVTEYECLSDNEFIDVETDNVSTGPNVGVEKDLETDNTPVTDSTPISVYNCSIQASCQTNIQVFVLLNRLQKVSGNCFSTISITGDGRTTEVDCDGPPTSHYTSIFNVASGFVGVQVRYRGRINGGFRILFRATNRNALLSGICSIGAKTSGISTLRPCGTLIKDNKTLNVFDDDDVSGTECGLAHPNRSDSNTGPSIYSCSVEASCITTINVYVLVNAIEEVNNICSCNITLIGDRASSLVTCDYPRPSYYNKVFSVPDGFVRAEVQYHQKIQGNFLILFRASDANASLTLACGTYAKRWRNPNTRSCDIPRIGGPSVGGPDDQPITDITFVDGDLVEPASDTVRGVRHCSVQASCLTLINVYVLRNTLREINGICSCNISIISDGMESEVACSGHAANTYTPIMVVRSGFVRIDIRHLGSIRGSFIIRFEAVNKTAKLVGYCGSRAKTTGISNLQTCPAVGEGDDTLEVGSNDQVIGSETTVTSPDYPGEIIPSPGNGPSVYYCSVQASCRTEINVFVLVNTLRRNNGVCTCNVTINGDGTSTEMTCDTPMGNSFLPIHSFTRGFIRLDTHYHGNIYGRFVISFRATNEYSRLTAGCGTKAKKQGLPRLDSCIAFGKDDGIEVHTDDTKNGTYVSLTNPGYTNTGTIPTTGGVSRYTCSVQASCFTDIDVFVLVNTLQKTNGVCSCNISLTSDQTQTDVDCDGPSQNRYTPILSSASSYVKVDVDYRNDVIGNFVIEFRAVNSHAILSVGCGIRAAQTGVSALGVCPEPPDEVTTIEVDTNRTVHDTQVTVTNPSSPGAASGPHWCSVQANCSSAIQVYVVRNTIDKVNGVCACTISLKGDISTKNITCEGPGSNRFVPIFTELSGFIRIQSSCLNGLSGQYSLKYEALEDEAIVSVSCGTHATLEGSQNKATCDPAESESASESSGGTSLGLIAGVVAALTSLLVIFVFVCVFRQKIRSKLCPEMKKVEPVDHMPIEPKIDDPSPSFRIYLYKEQNLENNRILENNLPQLSFLVKGREDTAGRRQLKRRPTLMEELVANAKLNEEIDKEKEERAERKRAKKRMRKLKNVFSAAKGFQLPQNLETQQVGTYRPLGEASMLQGNQSYTQGMLLGAQIDQPPLPFVQSVGGHSQTRGHYGPPPGPGLPDFSGLNVENDHPRPNQSTVRLPPLNFEPAKAWRKMGAVSGIAALVAMKRKTLDIADVDQPGTVEHNSLE